MATQLLPTIPGQKTAKIARAFDYLTLVPIILVLTGAFHLSMILTVGDWDFWMDWKDRQWWPLVTPLMAITFPAAVQYVLWTHFRLPMGATVCAVVLLIGMCYHPLVCLPSLDQLPHQYCLAGDAYSKRPYTGFHFTVDSKLPSHRGAWRDALRGRLLSRQLADHRALSRGGGTQRRYDDHRGSPRLPICAARGSRIPANNRARRSEDLWYVRDAAHRLLRRRIGHAPLWSLALYRQAI